MTATYPTTKRTFSTKTPGAKINAEYINSLQEEVEAVETQLIAGGVSIATATPAANAVPKAGADGKLAIGWMPAVPYKFSVWRNAAANSGNGAFATVAFDTELFDTGNNVSAGVFTAPVSGYYQFNARAGTDNASATEFIVSLFVNNTEKTRGSTLAYTGKKGTSCSAFMYMTAGQTVDVRVFGASVYALDLTAQMCYFSGFLVSL